jgi:mannose-6-phosphate isomerase-like protein (cupin superfamily)
VGSIPIVSTRSAAHRRAVRCPRCGRRLPIGMVDTGRGAGQSGRMTTVPAASPVRFEGSVANIARDWSMTIASAPPGPPRRIDGYTVGAIPLIDGPGPHGGEVHPDGDELLYVVSGTMELILDDGDERTVGAETRILLRAGDAYVVPRDVWHRLESVEPSFLVHVTPGPNGGHRARNPSGD